MKYGRRAFFGLLAAVGVAFGVFRSWHSLKVFFTPAKSRVESPGLVNPYKRNGTSLVAMVGGRDVKQMVKLAVSRIGGFEGMPVKGKTILIKPNVIGSRSSPTTTSPEVVRAVVELLYSNGADEVFVGDMSALIRGGTAKNMEKTGIKKAAAEAGAKTVSFEDHGWVSVEVSGRYAKKVELTQWFFNVDRVVNLPVIKTHRYAGYSICLKNLVGATHFSQRPYLIDRNHWE